MYKNVYTVIKYSSLVLWLFFKLLYLYERMPDIGWSEAHNAYGISTILVRLCIFYMCYPMNSW
jgi:hypothetical protein